MDDALARLLAEERRLVLDADWEGLAALAPRKEEALAARAPDDAGPLAGALRRNQALLLAAIEGLREGSRRRALLASARGLATYDATGARAEAPAPPRVERRA